MTKGHHFHIDLSKPVEECLNTKRLMPQFARAPGNIRLIPGVVLFMTGLLLLQPHTQNVAPSSTNKNGVVSAPNAPITLTYCKFWKEF